VHAPGRIHRRLRPDIRSGLALIDGNAWVRLGDSTASHAAIGLETTASGVIWMAVASIIDNDVRYEIVRWHPSDPTADVFPFDYTGSETEARMFTVLDDHSVAILDRNIGARIRVFTFP
jgi:hypothetical protein